MSSKSIFHAILPVFYPKRWIVLLLVSILMHLVAYEWVNGNLSIPHGADTDSSALSPQEDAPPVLISLSQPAPARQDSAPPTTFEKRPKPIKKPSKPRRSVPADSQVSVAIPELPPQETASIPDEPVWMHEENLDMNHSASASDIASAKEDPHSHEDQEAPPQAMQYKASAPPSAQLQYDVQGEQKGMVYHGTGTINWETDGEHYVITGKAKALFFTLLEFSSEGAVGASGIVPARYREKKGNKEQTDTYFNQQQNTISFSSSSNSHPLDNSAQDQISIIWQLASIGRGSPELFKPGMELDMLVAGTRNAENWHFRVVNQETIEIDGAPVQTWHIKSIRQKGSKEKTIDVWFASEREWYPVKLRHTEVNGSYVELSLSDFKLANR